MLQITDLKRQYLSLKTELDNAMQGVMASGYFIKGPALEDFEEAFADYIGTEHALGVNSGTDALLLALKALGIGHGDEVITTAMSYIATAEAISLAGATPVFVDIMPGTESLNPELIDGKITPKTRAILPVHLHGYPCEMQDIMKIAQRHGLKVIEDCAQSTGASYMDKKTGSWGDVGCFSFFPTKNLGAAGDGGMITTSDAQIAEQIQLLREHGCAPKNTQQRLGHNSRLDALQAAILGVKLPHLDHWNQLRREKAAYYHEALQGLEIDLPPLTQADAQPVFHHFMIQTHHRDELQIQMKEKGIECLPYYPLALPEQSLYTQDMGPFPVALRAARQGLALPLFPEIAPEEQDRVCTALKEIRSR